jgi:hypothetical protein
MDEEAASSSIPVPLIIAVLLKISTVRFQKSWGHLKGC